MKKALLIAAIIAAAFMAGTYAYAHELAEGFTGFDSPSKCKGCHSVIYGEWEGSMHAKSSKFSDPVHSAVHDAFSGAMEAKGKTANYHCANCHTPTADNMAALMKGEAIPDPSNATNTDGVTCAFCHMVSEVVEGKMFHGYKVTDGIKGGTHNSSAPHGVTYSEFNSSYEMCLGCHGKMVGGKGGVICSMEDEGVTDCLVCHMQETDGGPASGSKKTTHAFHGIHGAHDADMLRAGAKLSIGGEGSEITVAVLNPNTHSFPSTNPLRIAYVKVVAKDASGKVVFENFTDDPMQDKKAVFIKVFKAGENVGVPSWEAEGVAMDSRLAPGENRILTYNLPEGAASASAKLFYRFAPPKAVEKFGIPADGVVEVPQLVDEVDIKL
jgi:nitrate reductase cytochrome c-type subunit